MLINSEADNKQLNLLRFRETYTTALYHTQQAQEMLATGNASFIRTPQRDDGIPTTSLNNEVNKQAAEHTLIIRLKAQITAYLHLPTDPLRWPSLHTDQPVNLAAQHRREIHHHSPKTPVMPRHHEMGWHTSRVANHRCTWQHGNSKWKPLLALRNDVYCCK